MLSERNVSCNSRRASCYETATNRRRASHKQCKGKSLSEVVATHVSINRQQSNALGILGALDTLQVLLVEQVVNGLLSASSASSEHTFFMSDTLGVNLVEMMPVTS